MSVFWTQEQVAELLRRKAAGEKARQIGEGMGFTRNAVIGKLDRVLRKRKRAPKQKKRRRRR